MGPYRRAAPAASTGRPNLLSLPVGMHDVKRVARLYAIGRWGSCGVERACVRRRSAAGFLPKTP